jgi:hypothetical protein
MPKHAILTKRSERIVAAVASSGLLATGIVLPTTQAAYAEISKVGNTCSIAADHNSDSLRYIRNLIDDAIADVDCEVVEINNPTGEPLDLPINGTYPLYVGPSSVSLDTRRSITIKSTTGLNLTPWLDSSALIELANRTYSDGNFENFLETITIEGVTFRDSDRAIIGPDINADFTSTTLRVHNSRFEGNGRPGYNGGAIDINANVEIVKSIFSSNKGAAVNVNGDVSISSSLFLENEDVNGDYDGGAVFATGSIASVNSTYVENFALKGGALVAIGNIEMALNTFYNNDAELADRGAVFAEDEARAWGNIFIGSDELEVAAGNFVDYGYNLFDEGQTPYSETTSRIVEPEAMDFDSDKINDAIQSQIASSAPVKNPPAYYLNAASVAVDFVTGSFPGGSFSDYFIGRTSNDQLGTTRRSGAFDAGAHELRVATGGASIPVVVQSEPKTITVQGFAANSPKLTKSMKKKIRQFLKANPTLNNVDCRGFTSSPATAKDRVLARKRGKAACDYILTHRPDAQVKIQSGSHTNKPGSQIRRVNIKLS